MQKEFSRYFELARTLMGACKEHGYKDPFPIVSIDNMYLHKLRTHTGLYLLFHSRSRSGETYVFYLIVKHDITA